MITLLAAELLKAAMRAGNQNASRMQYHTAGASGSAVASWELHSTLLRQWNCSQEIGCRRDIAVLTDCRMSSFDLENALARSSDEEDAHFARRAYGAIQQPHHQQQRFDDLQRNSQQHSHPEQHPHAGAAQRPDLNLDAEASEMAIDGRQAPAVRPGSAAGGSSGCVDSRPASGMASLGANRGGGSGPQHGHRPATPAGDSAAQQASQTLEQRLRQAQSDARPASGENSTGRTARSFDHVLFLSLCICLNDAAHDAQSVLLFPIKQKAPDHGSYRCCAVMSALHDPHPAALRAPGAKADGAASPVEQQLPAAWLWFPDDQEWYFGNVVGHDPATGKHRVVYHIDGKVTSERT